MKYLLKIWPNTTILMKLIFHFSSSLHFLKTLYQIWHKRTLCHNLWQEHLVNKCAKFSTLQKIIESNLKLKKKRIKKLHEIPGGTGGRGEVRREEVLPYVKTKFLRTCWFSLLWERRSYSHFIIVFPTFLPYNHSLYMYLQSTYNLLTI